jgi:hypothetical protein
MIRMTISSLLTAFLILPITVAAHQGHGHGAGNELWHYLGSPAHILPAAIVLAVTVGILLFRRNRQTTASEEKVRNPK